MLNLLNSEEILTLLHQFYKKRVDPLSISTGIWECWKVILSEELKSPSADLPWVLDLIDPPTPSAENNFFYVCIKQLDDLLTNKEGTSVPLPPKLVASLPSNEALLPTIITPIGRAVELARRNGRDPTEQILSILESASSSFSDTTKFVVATVLASSSLSNPIVGERVSDLLTNLLNRIPSLPAEALLYSMKLGVSESSRPAHWMDKCIPSLKFNNCN